MIWYDAHCHLYDVDIMYDLDNCLATCRQKDISNWLSCVQSREELRWSLARNIPGMHLAAGIHPNYDRGTPLTLDELESLCREGKLTAIGEIGLDKRNRKTTEQLTLLKDQISLARMYNLPVVFHMVGHYDLLYKVLSDTPVEGIWHGFCAPREVITQFSRFGLALSLGTGLTKTLKHDIVNAAISYGNYLIETDAPFNFTRPVGGKDLTSNPLSNLIGIAVTLCRLNGVRLESLNFDIVKNAKHYFK